jgi:hypothetical protein
LLFQGALPLAAKAVLLFSFTSILGNPLLLRLLLKALALLIDLRLPRGFPLSLLLVGSPLLLTLRILALPLNLHSRLLLLLLPLLSVSRLL